MAGVKETKEAAVFLALLMDAGFESFADGKFDPLEDLQRFIPAVINAPAGIMGIEQIPTEAVDYTPEELAEVHDAFAANFDIPQADIEEFALDTLGVLITGQTDLSVLTWATKWIVSGRITRKK